MPDDMYSLEKWCEEKALEAHNNEREALTKYNGNDKYSTAWDVLVLNYRGRKEAFKEVLEQIRSNRVNQRPRVRYRV